MNAVPKNHKDEKVITCILPKGEASNLLSSLKDKHQISRANLARARGSRFIASQGKKPPPYQEKDILTVVTDVEQADDIFRFLFTQGNVDRPGGGFMYMSIAGRSTEFFLPENLDSLD